MFVFRSPSPAAGTPRAVSSELPTIRPAATRSFDVAGDAAVVVREPVQLEVVDQPVEPDRDARRPLEDLGRDLAGDRIGARLGQIEGRADLLALPLDGGCVGRLDALDEVVDLEHLDVRARLRVHLREVGVHVEHPRIRVPEEAEARGRAGCARRARRRAIRASTSQAGSPSSSVPVTVRYGMRARVNAPASSGTQQAEQFASHSPVVIAS